MWGYTDLEHKALDLGTMFNFIPFQPLNSILAAFFTPKSPNLQLQLLHYFELFLLPVSRSTYFATVVTSINHDCIDESIVLSTPKKSDKAPIPASLWDKRLIAMFPNCPVALKVLNTLIKWALSRHRVNLRQSFAGYLQIAFYFEWQDIFRGKCSSCKWVR